MLKMFRYLKRIISQFFERSYWYGNRKITKLWFDEDTNKWENVAYPKNARNIMNSTWEGESDIWYTVLLKLDHMFWDLKKYGFEKDYYFFKNDIIKYGTKEDKRFLITGALKEAFKELNEIWIFDGNINLSPTETQGCFFYLTYDKNKLNLICAYKKEKEKEKEREKTIVESWKIENDDFGSLAVKTDLNYSKAFKSFLDDLNIETVVKISYLADIILESLDVATYFNFAIKDINKISKQLRKYAAGNFVKCRDILHLRHLIKNLMRVSEDDTKYDYLWKNVKDNDQKLLAIEESSRRYNEDRREAYKKVMNFMCEKSLTWWD